MNNNTKAHLGLLGTNIFFAINLSAVKYLTSNNYMQPFGMNLIRVGVSVLLFWLLFFVNPAQKKIDKKDVPPPYIVRFFGYCNKPNAIFKSLPIHIPFTLPC